jgi:septum formation protein
MLYLASQSPRRAELLQQIGVPFKVIDAPVDETWLVNETLDNYVARVSVLKARAAAPLLDAHDVILAADTAGMCDGEPLIKPRDETHALAMLMRMSGRTHTVSTAITVLQVAGGTQETRIVSSHVRFRTLHEIECRSYWASGEPCDKAGSYAIQGLGAIFVERLEGSYSGVMGLPLCETAALLTQFGIPVWHTVTAQTPTSHHQNASFAS